MKHLMGKGTTHMYYTPFPVGELLYNHVSITVDGSLISHHKIMTFLVHTKMILNKISSLYRLRRFDIGMVNQKTSLSDMSGGCHPYLYSSQFMEVILSITH